MRITGPIYGYTWRGRGNNCNSYIFAGKKLVLFDPGHMVNELRESCFNQLEKQIVADGFSLQGIDLILCTHGHPDHVETAGLVREESGARLAIHRQDEFILELLEKHYGAIAGKNRSSLKPDFYLQEGELEQGGAEKDFIRIIHTPGHSPGSVCFYLAEYKTLITGDTIFENSIGRSDFPGGNINELEQSVHKLAALEEVELILPGHMGFISGADSARRNFDRILRTFFGFR